MLAANIVFEIVSVIATTRQRRHKDSVTAAGNP
jgi:hypothetical protein